METTTSAILALAINISLTGQVVCMCACTCAYVHPGKVMMPVLSLSATICATPYHLSSYVAMLT